MGRISAQRNSAVILGGHAKNAHAAGEEDCSRSGIVKTAHDENAIAIGRSRFGISHPFDRGHSLAWNTGKESNLRQKSIVTALTIEQEHQPMGAASLRIGGNQQVGGIMLLRV